MKLKIDEESFTKLTGKEIQKAPDYWNKLKLYTFDKVNALLKDERAKTLKEVKGKLYYMVDRQNAKCFFEWLEAELKKVEEVEK